MAAALRGLSARDVAEFMALERLEGPADYRRFDKLISWAVWCLVMWDKGQRPDLADFTYRWCEETEEEKQDRVQRQARQAIGKLKAMKR